MSKIKFRLKDDMFSHDKYSVAGRDSEFIEWTKNLSDSNSPLFYSHNRMTEINKNPSNENSYGLLFESRSIVPGYYSEVEKYIPSFKKVFTHNSDFLNKYSNCYWIPGGGIWIGGTYGGGEIAIKDKTKLCSIVSSTKRMCELHVFRLNIANYLQNSFVDIFGLNNWVPIKDTLENYMFSIVVENYQDDLYFTEKLLNCFATGVIPIYLGAKNIGDKFNIDGILCFNSIEELNTQLSKVSIDFYKSKLNAIEENFNLCQQYKSLEDYIFVNHFKNKSTK